MCTYVLQHLPNKEVTLQNTYRKGEKIRSSYYLSPYIITGRLQRQFSVSV